MLRGGERERVLSAHVTRRSRSSLPLLAALPCPPSASAPRRPRSRARVSGPTGCWRSGGGGGGEAGDGAGSAAGPGSEGSGTGALPAWSGRRRSRAGAALRAGPSWPPGQTPPLGVVTRSPEQGVCSPPEAAGGALGALVHRPGPAAAVRKINKNVIVWFLVGACNEREDNPSFSREEI